MQSGAVELLLCWRGRWAETSVVLIVGLVLVAFAAGAVALVQDYSAPAALDSVLQQ